MKMFDKKIRKLLLIISSILLLSLFAYMQIIFIEGIIGTFGTIVIFVLFLIITFYLNYILCSTFKQLDDELIESYTNFIMRDENNYFDNIEIKRIRNAIFFLRVICTVFKSVNNDLMFYCSFVLLMFLEIVFTNIFFQYAKNIKELLVYAKKLFFIQYIIYLLSIIFAILKYNFFVIIAILINCFTVPFLKEHIQNDKFENNNNIKKNTK